MAAEDDFAWTVVENKHQKKQKSTPSPSEKKRNWDKFQKDDSRVMREAHSKEHSVKKEGVSTGRCEDSTTISVQKRRGLIVLDKPIPRPERLDDPALWPSLPKAESRDSSSSGTAVSYSAAAKHTPPKQPKPVPHKDSSKLSHSEGEGAREEEQMKSKKKKKKKKKSEGQEQPTEHKANQPLLFDIGSMLEAYTSGAGQQGQSKSPNVKLTPNSAQHRLLSSKRLETELLATNPLDSSAPVKRRGKEREDPKKKRPSAMRRVLIKEREERHRIREQGLEIPQNLDVTASPTDPPLERNAVAVEVQSLPKHLHNRQYREYCDQMAEPQIDSLVEVLLKELGRFQDRVYLKEPQKFKIKRRYICGLREVLKHLKLKKLKAVIVAQNLDRITSTGGIDDVVFTLIKMAREQEIPVIFALTRQVMGKIMKKKVPISAVGIFNYDGAERYYKQLLVLVEEARQKYQVLLSGQTESGDVDWSPEQHPARESPREGISYQMCTDLLQSMRLHSNEDGNHDDSDEVGTPPDYEEDDSPPINDTPTTNEMQTKPNFVFNVYAPIFRPNFKYAWPNN